CAPGETGRGRQGPRKKRTGAAHGPQAARTARRSQSRRRRRARLRDLPRAWGQAGGFFSEGIPAGAIEMIGRLSGSLISKNPPQVLLDVAGVGYEIDVPMSTFYNLPATGEPVTLHTHLVVREDAHVLYGFATLEERAAFRQLIRISGIGARTALSVL